MKQRRDTRQRRAVKAAVLSSRDHPCADQLFESVREQDDKISRATVYRNLHILSEDSEVRQVKVDGPERYDWRMEPHHHILCRECRRLLDAPVPYRAEADAEISEQTGFADVSHSKVFEGVCPDCLCKK